MSEIRLDPYLHRFADRTRGMTASAIRALFAVASRPEIVSLAGGNPDTSALDLEAVAAVTAEVLAANGPQALQYGGGQGSAELREQLVSVMAAEGVAAHPDDLVVTTGGQQALDLITKLFCNPGDLIVAEGPSYVGALGAFSAYQAEVVHAPMDAEGLMPEALGELLDRLAGARRKPKLLYTIPNHQNPAGVSLSEERRRAVLAVAERYDLLVVEDNPYGLLDFKAESRTALRSLAPERVIYVGTLSKIFSPGVRVGWVAAPASVRDKLILLKEAADLCQSNLTQAVAQRWFSTQPWQLQVNHFREIYRQRCRLLLDAIDADFPAGCWAATPTGGLFLWVSLPEGMDSSALLAKALRARVAFVPGRAFYADGSGGGQLRLCFSSVDDERIREGARRLGEVLHEEQELVEAFYPHDEQEGQP